MKILKLVRKHEDPRDDMYNVAVDPNAPVNLVKELSESPDLDMRVAVAERPDLAEEIMLNLAKDPEACVREMLAENPALPEAILEILAADPEAAVRVVVAKRHDLSEEILKRLIHDPEAAVRVATADREDRAELPEKLQLKLVEDEESRVRWELALWATSEECLRILSNDIDAKVRAAVAVNPNASEAILTKLAMDINPVVRETVAEYGAIFAD